MLCLWAMIDERGVEGYAATLILPPYLAHLELAPFRFASQAANSDGREPLVLTYVGEGRVEEYPLCPKEHALPMIQFVCPGVVASRIRLPQDDASWHWEGGKGLGTRDWGKEGIGDWGLGIRAHARSASSNPQSPTPNHFPNPQSLIPNPPSMRIYFETASRTLHERLGHPVGQDAYVSVSRRHAFLGRPVVEAYLRAWLRRLGLDDSGAGFDFGGPSAAIELVAGSVGGQLLLDDEVVAGDLLQFAGLDGVLAQLGQFVRVDLEGPPEDGSGIHPDGIYIQLAGPAG